MNNIQYMVEHIIDYDVLDWEIEFTEEKAIETAKEMLDNPDREGYCEISIVKDMGGFYRTIEEDYITINK
tara:strand:+ start:150 stop:359 length:210 start_codon:yes stop_codon:yes gene_type:complete